jgi:hypothetical protein
MALSQTDQLLAEIAIHTPPVHDRVLQRLLDLTDFEQFSIGIRISVVVGGSIISGTLLSPRGFAKRLDGSLQEGMQDFLDSRADTEVEQAAGRVWREKMEGVFVREVQQSFDDEADLREKLEAIAKEKDVSDPGDLELKDLPEKVAFADLRSTAHRSALALEHATIAGPPSFVKHEIGTLRIQTAQIEAWWPEGIADSDPPEISPEQSS